MSDDPYVQENGVLINKFGITDDRTLDEVEADHVLVAIEELQRFPIAGNFDFKHYCDIHNYIFKDIYDWAGKPRTIDIFRPELALGGISVEYKEAGKIKESAEQVLREMNGVDWDSLSFDRKAERFAESLGELWKIHAFREGNTRTTIHFCSQFAKCKGFPLNNEIFKRKGDMLRLALVAYSVKNSYPDSKPLSKLLIDIVKKSIKTGKRQMTMDEVKKKIAAIGKQRKSDNAKLNPLPKKTKNKPKGKGE
jgi:cell filamentation protein